MPEEHNNFKDLFREEELRFERQAPQEDKVRSGIWRTLGFFKLLGQIIEMFIPRVFDVFVAAAGGDPNTDAKNYKKPPSQGPLDDDPRTHKPERPQNGDDNGRGPKIP